jgi:cyclophilin family peptidyl-prolyl cis-trans isomerase
MVDSIRNRRRRNARPFPEALEDRRLPAALAPFSTTPINVPSQQGYELPLDGSGAGDDQTFTIEQTSGSPDISASIAQGPFWTINVQYTDPTNSNNDFSGALVFQLFSQLTPNTVSEMENFTQAGDFTNTDFIRIANDFPEASDYILQGGTVAGPNEEATVGTPFLNENAQQLAFTGTYQLAMANAGVNTSLSDSGQGINTDDNQFFITTGSPNQVLGYGYTIFGQMIAGQDVIAKMTKVPLVTDPVLSSPTQPSVTQPANPLVMTSLSFSTGNPSGVAIIDTSQALPGDTATFQVTATDAQGSVSQNFTVTASPYDTGGEQPLEDPAIDFKPFANAATATVAEGGSTPITVTGQNGYPDTSTADAQYFKPTYSYTVVTQPSHGELTLASSSTTTPTAAYTYTADPGYSGPDSFQYTITENGPTPYLGNGYFGPATATTSNPATVAITVTPTPTPTPTPPTPTPPTPPAPTSPTPTPPPPTPTPTPTPPPPPLVTVSGVVDVTNKKHQVTEIHVAFSGAVNPTEAADAATYQLIKQGKHNAFVVTSKSTITIESASYDPTDYQVTLIPVKPFALSKPVEVVVEGEAPSGLEDAEGRLIDGNRDGQPGGNATAILSKGGASVDAIPSVAPSLAAANAVDVLIAQSAADGLVRSQMLGWLSPHEKGRRP